MFIWAPSWWDTLQHLLDWLLPVRCALATVERNLTTLSHGVEIVATLFDNLIPTLRVFGPGQVARARPIIEERGQMLLHERALVANLLDHRYRGRKLTPALRAKALRNIASVAEKVALDPPSLDEALAFIGETGAFQQSVGLECHPFLFWNSVHPDSTLAQLGKLLGSIPSSQASVERVFSTADWLATDRERLGFTKLAREVFIRYNFKALSA